MTMRWQCCQMNHRIGGTIPMFMQGSYRERERKKAKPCQTVHCWTSVLAVKWTSFIVRSKKKEEEKNHLKCFKCGHFQVAFV